MIVTLPVAALDAQPALAVDVTKSATVAAPPATAWKTIGAFRGICDWHPAAEKCVLSKEAGSPLVHPLLPSPSRTYQPLEPADDPCRKTV